MDTEVRIHLANIFDKFTSDNLKVVDGVEYLSLHDVTDMVDQIETLVTTEHRPNLPDYNSLGKGEKDLKYKPIDINEPIPEGLTQIQRKRYQDLFHKLKKQNDNYNKDFLKLKKVLADRNSTILAILKNCNDDITDMFDTVAIREHIISGVESEELNSRERVGDIIKGYQDLILHKNLIINKLSGYLKDGYMILDNKFKRI